MRVLMPLPKSGFDPTESSIPWTVLRGANYDVVFATPDGEPAAADPRLLSGRGFGVWRPFLRTDRRARDAYEKMAVSSQYRTPARYAELDAVGFDGLLLPGGHAPEMRPYLESETLQELAATFLDAGKPVAAICHGVLIPARAASSRTGQSALSGRHVTALTRAMEMGAWAMTCMWLGNYYRTYPISVQAEVTTALGDRGRFETGPPPLLRDAPHRLENGYVVVDQNLVTARWPGDAHRFAEAFKERLDHSLRA